MIKYFYVIICCLFSGTAFTQEGDLSSIFINTAFQTGETLKYEVKYGIFKGGEAVMSINMFPAGYTYVYHVKAVATTAGLAERFFTIMDIYESFIDIPTGLPVKAIRNIREEKYLSYDEVLFYRYNNTISSLKYGIKDVPPNTHDILSAFYYARRYLFSNNLKVNEIINLSTFLDGDLIPIKIRFKGFETVKLKSHEINCLKFVPVIEAGSTFKKEEDLTILVSNDGNYVPVKIRVELPIGSLKCDLKDFSGLKNKFGGNIELQ
jgi:hypothetical protein